MDNSIINALTIYGAGFSTAVKQALVVVVPGAVGFLMLKLAISVGKDLFHAFADDNADYFGVGFDSDDKPIKGFDLWYHNTFQRGSGLYYRNGQKVDVDTFIDYNKAKDLSGFRGSVDDWVKR